MATSAGKAGQPNEDFAGAVPGAAVLLDGAGIPGTESTLGLPGWHSEENAGVQPHTRLLHRGVAARRNQPGGYWIAKDDPHAAEEAVTGGRPLQDLDSVALLSNGASGGSAK